MAEKKWHLKIQFEFANRSNNFEFKATEASIIAMLLASYGMFEEQVKEFGLVPTTRDSTILLEEMLVLVRCVVFRKLEAFKGRYLLIEQL